jgi:hypothetical protein
MRKRVGNGETGGIQINLSIGKQPGRVMIENKILQLLFGSIDVAKATLNTYIQPYVDTPRSF